MKILVTGGAGFIGSSLIIRLLRERPEAEVVNLDLLTYAGNPENLVEVEAHPRYTFVHGDICDAGLVTDLVAEADAVVNLAAETHVDRSIAAAAPFVRTNVVGTQTLLAAALGARVDRFVQVSTDEVYGELPWQDPDDESMPRERFTEDWPLQPRSPYAASKAAADILAHSYHVTHDMNVVITRCSNNYGPRQYPEKLIPLAITRSLEGRPVPLYGDGLNVRDWIHVDDHCRGILAALERGEAGRVYNFGGDAERTNLSVIRTILAQLGVGDDAIRFVEDRPAHDSRYAMDTARARVELGWEPSVPFEEGLASTVHWYREHGSWWTAARQRASAVLRGEAERGVRWSSTPGLRRGSRLSRPTNASP